MNPFYKNYCTICIAKGSPYIKNNYISNVNNKDKFGIKLEIINHQVHSSLENKFQNFIIK